MTLYSRCSADSMIEILGRCLGVLVLLTGWSQAQTVAPTITSQPHSQSVSLGANVTFRVVATGTDPMAFQWRWKEALIQGATNTTYVLANVTVRQAGAYSVSVSNAAGCDTSTAAILAVDPT